MNILIDTNILIPLEDTSTLLDENFARARKLSSEQGHTLQLHPIQTLDIENDTDENRKAIMLSRISLVGDFDFTVPYIVVCCHKNHYLRYIS